MKRGEMQKNFGPITIPFVLNVKVKVDNRPEPDIWLRSGSSLGQVYFVSGTRFRSSKLEVSITAPKTSMLVET